MSSREYEDEAAALLPRFRPSPLDNIPIYSTVLSTYDLVSSRVDTSLKYDQLRSPQVQSFLIKPLVVILRQDLSLGTLYALMANMIQFSKESTTNIAMTGVMSTRAMICEILAIKLLKEYDADDLMDSLTYDFYPLAIGSNEDEGSQELIPRWQRVSALELAIKAEAKRLLAHPVVTQVLEEIWNGSIMFQSSMHKLHRVQYANEAEVVASGYGRRGPGVRYKYEEASMLKLSRLRVPRYRHLLSLFSFCVLLTLYLLVLSKHSMTFSTTELIFGLWSLGFILDEIIGFTDVGFTLYVLSLWNLFDLIILLLLLSYFACRFVAIRVALSDPENGRYILNLAYDILATIAIFLFPRLFSIFDNYESFSRMVIAVRKMSIDLAVSWLVIVMLSCGFWVAFTMAFARDVFSANRVAFDLLKILFGFTPTVWENWKYYSPIGRFILLFYLFITHFVILTILIAVLSNSFSAITENSHEEHQFLFAVNTISMIKSESSSLFSYSPPLNLVEWAVRPLYYVMPLRNFLVLNRTIVKVTHFPVLYIIFVYERLYLRFVQVRERLESDAERERRRQYAERVQAILGDMDRNGSRPSGTTTPNKKTRRRPGGGEHTPKRRLATAKSKVSQYDLLDEVFKRPYHGTIKVKSHPMPKSILRPQPSTLSRRGAGSEALSDPENTVRWYYDSQAEQADSEPMDMLDDEDGMSVSAYGAGPGMGFNRAGSGSGRPQFLGPPPFHRSNSGASRGAGSSTGGNAAGNASGSKVPGYGTLRARRTYSGSRSALPTVPSEVVLDVDHRAMANALRISEGTSRGRPVSRVRHFSTTSSILRADADPAALLGLSPTRSTSSILGGRFGTLARRFQPWLAPANASPDTETEEEADVEDEDLEDDRELGFQNDELDLWDMQRQMIARMDGLEVSFKKIEEMLGRLSR